MKTNRRVQWLAALVCSLSMGSAFAQDVKPDPLLAVDQNRTTVIERIVGQWGVPLEKSGAGLSSAQLRTMLQGLRADHLLAASLAGSLPGLRDVLANSLATSANSTSSRVHIQAIGDVADDLVYTPVNPCRLFDTRPAQGGLGVLNPNVRRTYGATSPVANQGGPGGCNAPAGAAVALIQIGTLSPAGNGYLQGGPQGIATFPNALILYQPGDQYGTSVAMPLNVSNGRFDVQVQFAATDLYGDLLGYFARPKNYGGLHEILGLYATDSGGFDNSASGNYSTVSGGDSNSASGNYGTVVGGHDNNASAPFSTAAGGTDNRALGAASFAAGTRAYSDSAGEFVWADNTQQIFNPGDSIHNQNGTWWADPTNTFNVRAAGGVLLVTAVDGNGYPLTGVSVGPGSGTWVSHSDRNVKENFAPVDVRSILEKVAQLPITSWNYIAEGAQVHHLGPVSQDFHAAFGLGADEHTIAVVDADGIALAAIQGLHQMLTQRDKEIATLKQKLQTIEAKLGL